VLVPAPKIVCDEAEEEKEGEEEPEKACQNALPRRCISVCDAIDASAACCGVGDDVDIEPSLGEEGGVGYMEKEDGLGWYLPLRAGDEGLLRIAAAEEK